MTSEGYSTLPTLHSAVDLLEWKDVRDKSKNAEYIRVTKQSFNIYDVKFYPHPVGGADSVFAACGCGYTFICRVSEDQAKGAEILRFFEDEDEDAELNSLCWTYDVDSRNPLVCISGGKATIKILDVVDGELVRTLAGHGASIQDLAVSPKNPELLASASADYSIRMWHLGKDFAKQPLAAILGGPDAHKQPLLSISFHETGDWLVSAGMDTAICLWRVPDLPNRTTGTDKPTVIHFPAFRSFEQHYDKIDCVVFYGDLIFSKSMAGEEKGRIILWAIDGFNANMHNHPMFTKAGPYPTKKSKDTWSAFNGSWQQLLTLDLPDSTPYWLRFSLLRDSSQPHILAAGNETGKVFFWNIDLLQQGIVGPKQATESRKSSVAPARASETRTTDDEGERALKSIGGNFKPQPAHSVVNLPPHVGGGPEVSYQTSWSADGKWCVVGGTHGRVYLCHREAANQE